MPVKRLLLTLLLAVPGWGISFLQTVHGASSGSATMSIAISPTAGNTLLIQLAYGMDQDYGTTAKTSDNTSCTKDLSVHQPGNQITIYFRCSNVAAGITSVLITQGYGTPSMIASISEIPANSLLASPVDVTDTVGAVSGTLPTTWVTGTITTTNAADIVFGTISTQGGGSGSPAFSAGSGWTLLDSYSNILQLGVVYQAETATGVHTPTGGGGTTGWVGCAVGIAYKLKTADYSISPASGSGYVTVASSNFTIVSSSGSSKTVTVSDGGNLGTITAAGGCAGGGTTPYGISLPAGATCTFTYTPAVVGSLTLTSTITVGTDPTPNTYGYTSSAASLTFSGCSSGSLRVASSTCTATLTGGTFDGTHTITLFTSRSPDTLTGGSSGNPLTVTPTNGTSSFTFTITPYLIGKAVVSATTNNSSWAVPTPFTYTVTRTDPCTMTANGDGTCTSAIWTATGGSCGSRPTGPDTGDTVVVTGHHVTVPIGTTLYMGTCPANNSTYDLQLADSAGGVSGWLEIAGKLWLCGNAELSANTHSLGDNPASWPILQLDTGAEFDIDENQNASVAYRMISSADYGWGKFYAGTAGDTCTFSTGSCPTTIKAVNLGAVNPDLFEATQADSLVYRIYGTGISDCGSASKGCLEYKTAGSSGYADGGVIDLQNNIFLRTGTFQSPVSGLAGTTPKPNFVGNQFRSDLVGVQALDAGSSYGGSSCNYLGNYHSGIFGSVNEALMGCNFVGNAWMGTAIFGGGTFGATIGQLANNLRFSAESDGISGVPLAQGNYLVSTDTSESDHDYLIHVSTAVATNTMARDNITESWDANAAETHTGIYTDGAPSTSYRINILSNLSIPAVTGLTSGTWQIYVLGSAISVAPSVMDHNGSNGTAPQGWLSVIGHGSTYYPANTVYQSIRSNLGYSASAGSAYYMFNDLDSAVTGAGTAPATMFNTSAVDFNNTWHGNSSTLFSGSHDANCAPASTFNATVYQICATTGGIGAHELAVNPKYIDPTRNLAKWATTHGQAASLAGIQAALQQCQNIDWCIRELSTYVHRGFQPTNLALKGKAHDGRIVGFTGTYGNGYTGGCTVTFTPQDAADLGTGAAATCSFVSGVPVIQIANPGANYRIATPATVAIGGTCTGGCVAASLTPVISPHDIGPVQMALIPGAM